MAKFCDIGMRLRADGTSARAVADYLAGYGEALADRYAEAQSDRAGEE